MTNIFSKNPFGPSQPVDNPTWYDNLDENFNDVKFKKRKGAKNQFGQELEEIIPKDGEIRMLGNKHRQCLYYNIGTDVCHT